MIVKILIAICIIITTSTSISIVNDSKIREYIDDGYSDRILDIVDGQILKYYCNNGILPTKISEDFLNVVGLCKEDVANIRYVKNSTENTYILSVVKMDGTIIKTSQNSGKELPVVAKYVDKTLVGVE